MLFGVATRRDGNVDTGIPERFAGLPGVSADGEIRRWGDTMRTGLNPGITFAEWREVPVPEAPAPVLLVRIPAAIVRPHMVTFQGGREIWRRGPAGRYQPDIQELRQMFLTGTTWLDQVEAFRRARVDLVRSRRAYPNVDVSSSFFVHVLPIGRLDQLLDLRPHEEALRGVGPLDPAGWSPRFNTFGFQTYVATASKGVPSYAQWFRHGGVEGYAATFRFQRSSGPSGVAIDALDRDLLRRVPEFVRTSLERMRSLFSLDPPFAVGIAGFGFVGARIYSADGTRASAAIESDVELLPPIIVEDPAAPRLDDELLSLLDIIWQSAGYNEVPRVTPPRR
jgi:hypothetical protein